MAHKGIGFIAKIGIFSLISLGLTGGYSYYVGNSIQSDAGVIEKILTGVSSSIESIGNNKTSIHSSFDFTGELQITQTDEELFSGKIQGDNIEIYANNTGLKQRVSVGKIETHKNIDGDTQIQSLENIDIITDNQYTYLSVGEGGKGFFSYLQNMNQGYTNTTRTENFTEVLNQISTIISQGKYAKIDNATVITTLFSNIQEGSWGQELLISLMTNNPDKYLEENKVYDEIKKSLYNDKWIDGIFTLSDNQVRSGKQTYVLDPTMCNVIMPISIELQKYLGQTGGDNIGDNSTKCKSNLVEINSILSLITQIYKQGDIEGGNYDFIIAQGNAVDIKLTYANHILQTWDIFLQDPQNNTVTFSISGNKFGIIESKIIASAHEEGFNISGEIVNGTGKITILTDDETLNLKGGLEFFDYKLLDMNIEGIYELDEIVSTFSAVGNNVLGKIDYETVQNQESLLKTELNYTNNSYKLDFDSEKMHINSLFKGEEFIFALAEKTIEGVMKNETKIVRNGEKISGFFKDKDIELDMKGEIISVDEFIIELDVEDNKNIINIHIDGEKVNDNQVDYTVFSMIDNDKIFDLTATKKIGEREGFQNIIFNLDVDIPSEDINLTLSTQKTDRIPEKKYMIPENIEQVMVKYPYMIGLPNLHYLQKALGGETFILATGLGSIGATFTYTIGEKDAIIARNSKRLSDVSILVNIVEKNILNPEFKLENIVIVDKEKGENTPIKVSGNKVIEGENYFIGDINYDILGQNKNTFISEGFNYKIAVYSQGPRKQYQILTFLEEGNKEKKVFVQGNYVSKKLNRYNFLLKDGNLDGEDNEGGIVTQLELEGTHDLSVGDNTNVGIILEVDGNTITIEEEIKAGVTKVYMLGNDASSLFTQENRVLVPEQIIKK